MIHLNINKIRTIIAVAALTDRVAEASEFDRKNSRQGCETSTHWKERGAMIITERAGEMLRKILEETQSEEEQCIRLDYSSGEGGMRNVGP